MFGFVSKIFSMEDIADEQQIQDPDVYEIAAPLFEKRGTVDIDGTTYKYSAFIRPKVLDPGAEYMSINCSLPISIRSTLSTYNSFWIVVTVKDDEYIDTVIIKRQCSDIGIHNDDIIDVHDNLGEYNVLADLVHGLFVDYVIPKVVDRIFWNVCMCDVLSRRIPCEISKRIIYRAHE